MCVILCLNNFCLSCSLIYFVHVICRLGCLVVLVAVVIHISLLALDLTQFGDDEKNPGPLSGL